VVYGSGASEVAVPFVPAILKGARMRWFIVYNLTHVVRDGAVARLTQLLETGALKHNIGAHLPLAQIAEAHELVERGAVIGNVVLSIT
jgi:NADPH2:quinone reductase